MIEDKPLLDQVIYRFMQEPNTNGTTGSRSDDEILSITYESVLDSLDDEPGFYVIRTDGWSINEPKDLLGLFDQIKNIKF